MGGGEVTTLLIAAASKHLTQFAAKLSRHNSARAHGQLCETVKRSNDSAVEVKPWQLHTHTHTDADKHTFMFTLLQRQGNCLSCTTKNAISSALRSSSLLGEVGAARQRRAYVLAANWKEWHWDRDYSKFHFSSHYTLLYYFTQLRLYILVRTSA